jgi:hypothetical protein
MVHEASTENIVLRVLCRANFGHSAAMSATHNAMNAKDVNASDQKPGWAKSIPQRRLRWLLKQHPRMDIEKLRMWSG